MALGGLHHVTLISANIERTARFYTDVLGLRLIKQTVNFDDPSAKHLYFGDGIGTPGTIITYFEWPHLSAGETGVGMTHHVAFAVEDDEALARWWVRLRRLGLEVTNPRPRRYFTSIYFRDPDGVILEIATRAPGFTVDEPADALGRREIVPPSEFLKPARVEAPPALESLAYEGDAIVPSMQLQGVHHITLIASAIDRTTEFYTGVLGLHLVKRTVNFDDPTSPHYYYGDAAGHPGTLVTYFGSPKRGPGRMGAGVAHHFALLVETDAEQEAWLERLRSAGIPTTDIIDRKYFRSIYFNDPDGVIVEIATRGPGFLVDEDLATLGTRLILPDWVPLPARN